jgi:hypothetical protein
MSQQGRTNPVVWDIARAIYLIKGDCYFVIHAFFPIILAPTLWFGEKRDGQPRSTSGDCSSPPTLRLSHLSLYLCCITSSNKPSIHKKKIAVVFFIHQCNYCPVSFAKIGNIGVFSELQQCCSINYRCTVRLCEAGIVSLAHWSSLDRQICIVSYGDTIFSMQYLCDIFTVLYSNMATIFLPYVPPNCNFKKGRFFLNNCIHLNM